MVKVSCIECKTLKFTPLEFETITIRINLIDITIVKIYSVGV